MMSKLRVLSSRRKGRLPTPSQYPWRGDSFFPLLEETVPGHFEKFPSLPLLRILSTLFATSPAGKGVPSLQPDCQSLLSPLSA